MPRIKGQKTDAETIAKLKAEYLEFYEDCPRQALAAQYIMRSSETITDWKAKDPEFASMILQAESKFARKELRKSGAEWKLARIMNQHFPEPPKPVELSGTVQIERATFTTEDPR